MDDDTVAVEIEDTRGQRAAEVEERLGRLRGELEVNGRLNAALARAAGFTAIEAPEELLRQIEEVADRVRNTPVLTRADFPTHSEGIQGLDDAGGSGQPPAVPAS